MTLHEKIVKISKDLKEIELELKTTVGLLKAAAIITFIIAAIVWTLVILIVFQRI